MQEDLTQMPENKATCRSYRYGLFALVLIICIMTGGYFYTASVNQRLAKLEALTNSQTSELSGMRERVFTSALQEGKYASLNARMTALGKAFISLEGKLTQLAAQRLPETHTLGTLAADNDSPVPTVAPAQPGNMQRAATPPPRGTPGSATAAGSVSMPGAESGKRTPGQTAGKTATVTGSARPQPAIASAGPASVSAGKAGGPAARATPQMSTRRVSPAGQDTAIVLPTEPTASGTQGPWVINLLSSRDRAYAEQVAARARASGIGVEILSAEVRGRTYWRLQVPGFPTSRAARAGARPVKEKLGIQEVWIHRR